MRVVLMSLLMTPPRYIIIFIFILSTIGIGTATAGPIERAERHISRENYDSAIKLLRKALQKDADGEKLDLLEKAQFLRAQSLSNTADWEAFLKAYPQSRWLKQARVIEPDTALRSVELRRVEQIKDEPPFDDFIRRWKKYLRDYSELEDITQDRLAFEDQHFSLVEKASHHDLWTNYLNTHPKGVHREKAEKFHAALLYGHCPTVPQEDVAAVTSADTAMTHVKACDLALTQYPMFSAALKAEIQRIQWRFHWASLRNTIPDWESFLEKLAAFEGDAPEIDECRKFALAAMEPLVFETAKQQSSIEQFENYLDTHPNGKFADEARVWLAKRRLKMIAIGSTSSCGINEVNQLLCWRGSDKSRRQHGPWMIDVPPEKYRTVSTHLFDVCALGMDYRARCWTKASYSMGKNAHGDEVPPKLKFKDLQTGPYGACGLTFSGQIRCWGGGWIGPALDKVVSKAGTMRSFSLSREGPLCAIKSNRDVICWDKTGENPGKRLPGKFKSVSVGPYLAHICGITTANTVECSTPMAWHNGKLVKSRHHEANGETLRKHQPETSWKAKKVVVLNKKACALGLDGTIKCWGSRGKASAPSSAPLTNIRDGFFFSGFYGFQFCVITEENQLICTDDKLIPPTSNPPLEADTLAKIAAKKAAAKAKSDARAKERAEKEAKQKAWEKANPEAVKCMKVCGHLSGDYSCMTSSGTKKLKFGHQFVEGEGKVHEPSGCQCALNLNYIAKNSFRRVKGRGDIADSCRWVKWYPIPYRIKY